MQHGDIDNTSPQRLLVVFEGLVGLEARARRQDAARRLLRRAKVAAWQPEDFRINALARDAIWRETHRSGWHVDVVTYLGDGFGYELAEWLPRHMVHAPVVATSPGALARQLAHRPDIRAVYDPDPARMFTYGHLGRVCPPEKAASIIGRS